MKGVSVIVCCHNSSSRLPRTIQHLAQQKTKGKFHWEIILVNNASSDNTENVAREQWGLYNSPVPFKIIDEDKPGLSNARNAGINEAGFEYLLFCDDDNWLNENYVSLVFEILSQNDQIGVLGGCNLVVSDGEIPFWFSDHEAFYAVGHQGVKSGELLDRNFVFGAGMALRKSVYQELVAEGFRHLLTDRTGTSLVSGGDVELCYIYKIVGYKIWYDKRLILEHYMPANRLTKEYLKGLEKGAFEGLQILQLYDPYFQFVKRRSVFKIPLFFYFLARYCFAFIRNKNPAYFLTYIEANNFLPVCFSPRSAGIRKTIQGFRNQLKD